jgi:hypothetical protein
VGLYLAGAWVAYTGDREVASDAMAEAFAQALARGDELRSAERWVWHAAFRIAAGELTTRGRDRPMIEDLSDTTCRSRRGT